MSRDQGSFFIYYLNIYLLEKYYFLTYFELHNKWADWLFSSKFINEQKESVQRSLTVVAINLFLKVGLVRLKDKSTFNLFLVLNTFIKLFFEFHFRLPTDVQSEAIPLILGGGDVLMAAETGSGKTGSFFTVIFPDWALWKWVLSSFASILFEAHSW